MTQPQPVTKARPPFPLTGRDRRKAKRIPLRLTGRFLTAESDDRELLTADISCDGAFILSGSKPAANDQIVCYFDELGRVVSEVIRATADGFAVRFNISAHKRDKLADRLTWLLNRDALGLAEERSEARFPVTGYTQVILGSGRKLDCRMTDISLTGAAFQAVGAPPAIGDKVIVGRLLAEVVRVSGPAFAVRHIGRAPTPGNQD
jgi:hypothetical protein